MPHISVSDRERRPTVVPRPAGIVRWVGSGSRDHEPPAGSVSAPAERATVNRHQRRTVTDPTSNRPQPSDSLRHPTLLSIRVLPSRWTAALHAFLVVAPAQAGGLGVPSGCSWPAVVPRPDGAFRIDSICRRLHPASCGISQASEHPITWRESRPRSNLRRRRRRRSFTIALISPCLRTSTSGVRPRSVSL